MKFNLDKSLEILQQTPLTLRQMMGKLSDEWIAKNEGNDTWSPYDVVGHLIHGEKTDWIPRLEVILADGENKTFEVFDRFAQFEYSKGKSLTQLLNEFESLRSSNLLTLQAKSISEEDLTRKGIHPEFGEVSASQLLSTWVVHDLNHIAQIARVMAFQYKSAVGPWVRYLGVLNK